MGHQKWDPCAPASSHFFSRLGLAPRHPHTTAWASSGRDPTCNCGKRAARSFRRHAPPVNQHQSITGLPHQILRREKASVSASQQPNCNFARFERLFEGLTGCGHMACVLAGIFCRTLRAGPRGLTRGLRATLNQSVIIASNKPRRAMFLDSNSLTQSGLPSVSRAFDSAWPPRLVTIHGIAALKSRPRSGPRQGMSIIHPRSCQHRQCPSIAAAVRLNPILFEVDLVFLAR